MSADADDLWFILTGVEDDGDSDDEGNPGYERDAEQRREDCDRVREMLDAGMVSADARHPVHGSSLLYHALRYDHRNVHEMIAVVVTAGCDVNLPTHETGDELPLDCELWLETDGPFASVNQRKRDFLISHGARHSDAAAARRRQDAADAAEAAAAKEAALAEADAALEQRLLDARRAWHAERVPTWDESG